MAVHTICETTNLAATKYAERIFDAVADEVIENGTLGHLEDQVEEGSHIYKFVKGVKAGFKTVLAHNPEWKYEYHKLTDYRRDQFAIEAGTPFRAYVLKATDEFALSTVGFEGTPATGKFVSVNADGKLKVEDSEPADAEFVGHIERVRNMGGQLITAAHTYGDVQQMFTVMVKKTA